MHVRHASFDISAGHELRAALGDFDRAKLARPIVEILEQMAGNCPQVRKIEHASWRAFPKPLLHDLAFDTIERIRVFNAKPVSENP